MEKQLLDFAISFIITIINCGLWFYLGRAYGVRDIKKQLGILDIDLTKAKIITTIQEDK